MHLATFRFVICALSLALLGACSIGAPSAGEDRPDASPIRVKTPTSNEKKGTAPGCGGITAHGVCEDGVAVVCDVNADELRRTDCGALGQRCVVDSGAGATCQDASEASCDSGLDFEGVCDGEVARWCDAEGDKSWDCAAAGLSCQVDVCEDGAFCCGEGGGEIDPECEELGFAGECGGDSGQVARYCNGGELVELDCGSDGEYSCQVDSCAEGAYCCPGDLECPDLGFEGECAGNSVRYCNAENKYREVDCDDFGMLCGTDCGEGADCCEPTCDDIPQEGTCIGDWLIFCEVGELRKVNCPEDEPEAPNCIPEGEFGFAQCSP